LKNIFKDEVYLPLKSELIDSFLELVQAERMDQVIDFSFLKNFVKFMNTLEVAYLETLYTTELEQKVIETSGYFYSQIVQAEFMSKTYIDYLDWCSQVIKNEETRLGNYLTTATTVTIVKNIKNILFFQNSKVILETGDSFKAIILGTRINVKIRINI
jgi:hypothetical protein